MENHKQEKILKKIIRSTDIGGRESIGGKPNDECYPSMQDILNEMSYWADLDKFRDKDIICPCDWDIAPNENIYSIRIDYDADSIKIELGMFDDNNEVILINLKDAEIDNFLKDKLVCNFVRTFSQQARNWGLRSITASGYNPANGIGVMFQDIDFSKYDVCVVNPPVSLYGKLMKCLLGKIDFICLAPFLNRVTPNVGLPLMLQKAYLGFNAGLSMNFTNPKGETPNSIKALAVDWITSFNEAQELRNEELKNHKSGINYEDYKNDYLIMENMLMRDKTYPIRVPGTAIPDNYNGWMFAPVTCLHKIALSEFEWYGTCFHKYFNSTNPEASPFMNKVTPKTLLVNGKQMFGGIVLRRK